jgi:hypothetical protein
MYSHAMTEALTDLWRTLAVNAPKALLFIAILAVGWFIAKLVGQLVGKLLFRVGLNRLVEKVEISRSLKLPPSEIAGKLVYYAGLLIVLQAAFGVFGPNPVSGLLTSVIAFLPRLLVALVLIVVAVAISSAVRSFVENAIGGLSYGSLVANIASIFVLGLGIIAALGQVGVALTVTLPVLVTVLATVGGILVVGVGGGLIRPMQARWENYLTSAENEGRSLRDSAVDAVE